MRENVDLSHINTPRCAKRQRRCVERRAVAPGLQQETVIGANWFSVGELQDLEARYCKRLQVTAPVCSTFTGQKCWYWIIV